MKACDFFPSVTKKNVSQILLFRAFKYLEGQFLAFVLAWPGSNFTRGNNFTDRQPLIMWPTMFNAHLRKFRSEIFKGLTRRIQNS